jgi:hypothetical protein
MTTKRARAKLTQVADGNGRDEEVSRVQPRPPLEADPAVGAAPPRANTLVSRLQRAEQLLRTLPATDARLRLLGIAVLRRDQALLDALIREV